MLRNVSFIRCFTWLIKCLPPNWYVTSKYVFNLCLIYSRKKHRLCSSRCTYSLDDKLLQTSKRINVLVYVDFIISRIRIENLYILERISLILSDRGRKLLRSSLLPPIIRKILFQIYLYELYILPSSYKLSLPEYFCKFNLDLGFI